MKPLIAAMLGGMLAVGSACATVSAATVSAATVSAATVSAAPVATPVYKKAPPAAKHKKVLVKKERNKKPA